MFIDSARLGLEEDTFADKSSVCSDRAIVKKAPNMLQRCMSMLIESKEFWPLASRWLESLERFSRDPRANVGMDSGMADGVSLAF